MNKKMIWAELLIVLAPFVAALYFWDALPDQIPRHYNIHGEVDAYAPKGFVFFLPALNALLALILNIIPKIDPRGENFGKFRSVYNGLVLGGLSFLSILSLSEILKQAGIGFIQPVQTIDLVGYLLGVMFILLGIFIKKIEPNYFVGVRTPWTLENAEVWRRTHRFSGKLFTAAGVVLVGLKVIASPVVFFAGMLVVILGVTLVCVVYSYLEFQKEKRKEAVL